MRSVVVRGMTNAETLRFIAHCLAHESTASLSHRIASGQIDWTRVVALSSGHYVVPSLYSALRNKGLLKTLPTGLEEYLHTLWSLNRTRNERIKRQLTDLAAVLNTIGIVPLLLKGANALLPNAWPGAFDRILGDLDLLLPVAQLPKALSALRNHGYIQEPESFRGSATARLHHLLPLVHPEHPASVELHRELGNHLVAPLLPCAEVRRLARPRELDGAHVLQPTLFWRLLHLLLHTCVQDRHHQRRSLELRQLNEWVQWRKVGAEPIDWAAMQQHLSQGRRPEILPTYLSLAETLCDQPVPDTILIGVEARRRVRQTLEALDSKSMARRFRTSIWLHGLPKRLVRLPPKLIVPSWYGYQLRRLARKGR